MIQIAPQMRILLATEPVDFRKGIDGLARLCRTVLQSDPFSGSIFVFRNRTGKSIKVLIFDTQGFWLAQKRLSRGRFAWWPQSTEGVQRLGAHQLQLLLWNGNPAAAKTQPAWRQLNSEN